MITLGAGYAEKLVVDGVTVRRGRYQGEWAVLSPTDARVRVSWASMQAREAIRIAFRNPLTLGMELVRPPQS